MPPQAEAQLVPLALLLALIFALIVISRFTFLSRVCLGLSTCTRPIRFHLAAFFFHHLYLGFLCMSLRLPADSISLPTSLHFFSSSHHISNSFFCPFAFTNRAFPVRFSSYSFDLLFLLRNLISDYSSLRQVQLKHLHGLLLISLFILIKK